MATAPRPGTTSPQPAREFTFTFRGSKVVFRPADLGPMDDLLAYRETNGVLPEPTSIMTAMQRMDSGTIWMFDLALIIWIALRKSGDTAESFAEFLAGVSLEELETMDPELTETVEDESDPLPSAAD